MTTRPLTKLRKLALALPEATEKEAWGEPTFRVRDRMFATYADAASHHGAGRPAAWIKAAPENQDLLVRTFPDRYFKPPYVGPKGWIGAWLDEACDWKEVAGLLEDGWRMTAPKRLTR